MGLSVRSWHVLPVSGFSEGTLEFHSQSKNLYIRLIGDSAEVSMNLVVYM